MTATLTACGEQPVQKAAGSPAALLDAESGARTSPRDSAASAPRLASAKYFVNPAHKGMDIDAIRRSTDRKADIAGRYSTAIVSCGTGCTAFWIVDRRTGAIIDVPESANGADTVHGIEGRAGSEIVRIFYESPVDSEATCWAQDFRLAEASLVMLGEPTPVPCPN